MYCFFVATSNFRSGSRTGGLEDSQNSVTCKLCVSRHGRSQLSCVAIFLTSDKLDLGNTVGVTEDDTDLRRSGTLTGELGDLLNDLLGGGLQPGGSVARVRESRGRNALSVAVKSAHLVGLAAVVMLGMRSEWSCSSWKVFRDCL
jgi:hypothetical protein